MIIKKSKIDLVGPYLAEYVGIEPDKSGGGLIPAHRNPIGWGINGACGFNEVAKPGIAGFYGGNESAICIISEQSVFPAPHTLQKQY